MKGTKGGGVNILLIFSVEASDNRLQPWDSEKSRIPEPETPECKNQVTIPERSHEKLSADAQLLEVTNPEWSGLGDRRVRELHGDPGAPKLYTKEDQVHLPEPEIVSKKQGFHISYATFLEKKMWLCCRCTQIPQIIKDKERFFEYEFGSGCEDRSRKEKNSNSRS